MLLEIELVVLVLSKFHTNSHNIRVITYNHVTSRSSAVHILYILHNIKHTILI